MDKAEESRDYKNLVVWQVAMAIVDEVYVLTEGFPTHERYALANQMQRAAVSVASNIAEGHGRNTKLEYLHALGVSRGSLAELETQLIIAARRSYMPEDHPVFASVSRCRRLIQGLMKSLR
ncbi:MAG: four helix bundle protein [Armatimonadota bacterium]